MFKGRRGEKEYKYNEEKYSETQQGLRVYSDRWV